MLQYSSVCVHDVRMKGISMCWLCDMLKDVTNEEESKPPVTPWSTSNINAFRFYPLPEQQPEEKREIDMSGLSEDARDVIGLIRCNARPVYTNAYDRHLIVPIALRHGVKRAELQRLFHVIEQ